MQIETQDTIGCSVCSEGYSIMCNELNANHLGSDNVNPNDLPNFIQEANCFKQNKDV